MNIEDTAKDVVDGAIAGAVADVVVETPEITVPELDITIPDPMTDIDVTVPKVPTISGKVTAIKLNISTLNVMFLVNTSDIATPDIDTPDITISAPDITTPMIDEPKVKGLDIKTPDVKVPIIEVPEIAVATPDIGTPDVETPDITIIAPDIASPMIDEPKIKGVDTKVSDVKVPVISIPEIAVGTPEIATPDVETPDITISAPDVATPVVDAPKVKGVNIKTPDVKLPGTEVPEIATPNVDVPALTISAPEVSVPIIDAPKVKGADIKTPRVSFDVSTPAIESSNISNPEVDIDLKIPDVKAPEMDIEQPNVKSPKPSFGTNLLNCCGKPQTLEDIEVPKVDVNVPKTEVEEPKIDVNVETPDLKSPDLTITAPGIKTSDGDAPKIKGVSNPLFIPELAVETPDITTPNTEVKVPESVVPAKPSAWKSDLFSCCGKPKTLKANISDVEPEVDVKTPVVDLEPVVEVPEIAGETPDVATPDTKVKVAEVELETPAKSSVWKSDLFSCCGKPKTLEANITDVKPEVDLKTPVVDLEPVVEVPEIAIETPDVATPDTKVKVPESVVPAKPSAWKSDLFSCCGKPKTLKANISDVEPEVDVKTPVVDLEPVVEVPEIAGETPDVATPDTKVKVAEVELETPAKSSVWKSDLFSCCGKPKTLEANITDVKPEVDLKTPVVDLEPVVEVPEIAIETPDVATPDTKVKVPESVVPAKPSAWKSDLFNCCGKPKTLEANISDVKPEVDLKTPAVDLEPVIKAPEIAVETPDVATPDTKVKVAEVEVEAPAKPSVWKSDLFSCCGKPKTLEANITDVKPEVEVKTPTVGLEPVIEVPEIAVETPDIPTPGEEVKVPAVELGTPAKPSVWKSDVFSCCGKPKTLEANITDVKPEVDVKTPVVGLEPVIEVPEIAVQTPAIATSDKEVKAPEGDLETPVKPSVWKSNLFDCCGKPKTLESTIIDVDVKTPDTNAELPEPIVALPEDDEEVKLLAIDIKTPNVDSPVIAKNTIKPLSGNMSTKKGSCYMCCTRPKTVENDMEELIISPVPAVVTLNNGALDINRRPSSGTVVTGLVCINCFTFRFVNVFKIIFILVEFVEFCKFLEIEVSKIKV